MVSTGLDTLLAEHLAELEGLRVGIVANHASVTKDLKHISDALVEADVKVAALYGPEHGVRGDMADGIKITDAVDPRLGVPVFSLYGQTTKPSPDSLKNIDLMLIDLQDIGSRFYTFIYTMGEVMAACGEAGIPVWILDRPNPITGSIVEGPVLEDGFSYSVFSQSYELPIRHGLTIGELAILFTREFGIKCDLRIIRMNGWHRDMWYDETGLPWVMPSPNIPTIDSTIVYPGLCLIEGTNVSEGRGTTRPFEIFGAPWIVPSMLINKLMKYGLPGVAFRETYFMPWISKFSGEQCSGLQVYATDKKQFQPILTGIAVISALYQLYPDNFSFREPSRGNWFFDILCGTDSIRNMIYDKVYPCDIEAAWVPRLEAFKKIRKEVLLY